MNFKHVYLFLVPSGTFYWRFTPNVNNELVHMEKSYLGYRCCTTGNPPREVAPGQRKTHVNSYRRQTVHRGKVDPGVSELPRGNELSRDHLNRPLVL